MALEAQIYSKCVRYYPFVLGAEPVRPIDLAAFYAAIANEGLRPAPYVVDTIERNGQVLYHHEQTASWIHSVDRAAFYQLKTMLQSVLARGTARAIAGLAPYVAGKTGTSDDENDAWFVGFTNDVTVAVWVGYDSADGKRRTLGGGSTGGAASLFRSSMRCGPMSRQKPSLLSPHLKRSASSAANRLTSSPATRPGSLVQKMARSRREFYEDRDARISILAGALSTGRIR